MEIRKKPHAAGKVKAGDTSQRVGVEQIAARPSPHHSSAC
jgi:hypothetical protein